MKQEEFSVDVNELTCFLKVCCLTLGQGSATLMYVIRSPSKLMSELYFITGANTYYNELPTYI
jgi:hypothetical protein